MEGIDYEGDAQDATVPPVPEESLRALQGHCLELEQLKAEEDDLKIRLKQTQGRIAVLRIGTIPDMMRALNLVDGANRGSFTLPSGARISMRTDFYASINKAREEEAFDWLRGAGLGDIIRMTVNASTLKATLRERLEDGKDIPEGIVTTYFETSAVLTRR